MDSLLGVDFRRLLLNPPDHLRGQVGLSPLLDPHIALTSDTLNVALLHVGAVSQPALVFAEEDMPARIAMRVASTATPDAKTLAIDDSCWMLRPWSRRKAVL